MRLDQLLIQKGFARSRSQAKELIKKSLVKVDGVLANKASQECSSDQKLEILESDLTRFVSRAGLKMQNAISKLKLDITGKTVLDIGLSTGGFSDCLLQSGAKKIVGIDVGHSQLANELKTDPRLISFDGINAKALSSHDEVLRELDDLDLIVMDVSFISITKIIPELDFLFREKKIELLSLVKPQFELEKKNLNKQGIVKNTEDYEIVKKNVLNCFAKNSLELIDYFSSGIEGGDGNEEFFVYAKKSN